MLESFMTRKFVVISMPDKDGYFAECPALPGCVATGSTRHEAWDNIRAAIVSVLKVQQSIPIRREIKVAEVTIYDDDLS
jgi:predicted RNase H-like HicB family nuclease